MKLLAIVSTNLVSKSLKIKNPNFLFGSYENQINER